jgi:hypothetical protein
MKLLNFGNLAIVFILIVSVILSPLYSDFLSIAFVLGLFVMPVYQILVGLIWFITSAANDIKIKYYFTGVLIYFLIIFSLSGLADLIYKLKILQQIVSVFFGGTPVLLALYFTYILNQYSRK